jgi:adenylate cyclase
VFDILFPEPDFPRANVSARQSDERFATALEAAGNVTLAVQLTASDTTTNPIDSTHVLDHSVADRVRLRSGRGALAPIPSFQEGAAALGAVNMEADGDGVVRRVPLAYQLRDSLRLPNLGVSALLAGGEAGSSASALADLPVGPKGAFMLYWYGPGGVEGVFEDQYYSIQSLIVSAARMQIGATPIVPPQRFQGKTIIVGGIAAGLHDHHSTPVGGEGDYPGMEIFATFLSNVYQGHFLQDFTVGWSYLFILLTAIVGAGLVAVRPDRIGRAAVVLLAVGGLYVGGAAAAFYYLRWWIPVVAPVLALVAGFSATSAVSYAVEGRRRRELRSMFQRYVSPQVVDEVVQNPETLTLGGEEVEGTVFFSDIKGFTTVAEQLTPREVVQRLNEYFGVSTDVVLDHRAMVDKFIGDAIMAVFGAPVEDPEHPAQACLAALEMEKMLSAFYDQDDHPDRPPFQSRIGIHTGRIVVGNIGTERRVDYTAIGDAVNVAARLEQANKQYGTRILISQSTYEQAKGAIEAREIDLLRLTGKETPIRVFEVLAPSGDLTETEEHFRETFEEGLAAYRSQRWMRARQSFATVLEMNPDDGPAAVYQQRVEERAGETLPSNWKGIHEMNVGK